MEEKKEFKLYQKWWFWVCIVLIILIVCMLIYCIIQNSDKVDSVNNKEETEINKQEDSLLCFVWEDFKRLERKDSGKNITTIGFVDSIEEEYVEDKQYYWTKIGLIIYDNEAYPHLITVIYNRPYEATKILKDDLIWVYGTYQYPLFVDANNIEISE